jgi:hypothetical protein
VNLTNSPAFGDASLAFFQTTMDNLLAAAKDAGVGRLPADDSLRVRRSR